MHNLSRVLVAFSIVAAFAIPFPASALVFYGGIVATAIPCVSPLGPSYYIITKPAPSTFIPTLIWTPATMLTRVPPIPALIPPTIPGTQVWGIADIPYSCLVGKVPVYGLRMQTMGKGLVPLRFFF